MYVVLLQASLVVFVFSSPLRRLVYLTRLFSNLTGNYKEFSTNGTVKLSSEAVFVAFYCLDIESRARCSVIVFSGSALIEKHRYLFQWRLFRFWIGVLMQKIQFVANKILLLTTVQTKQLNSLDRDLNEIYDCFFHIFYSHSCH